MSLPTPRPATFCSSASTCPRATGGTALHYLGPILAFIVGLALSDLFRLIRRGTERLHWRQVTVALEAIVLFIVSFLPQSMNLLGNSLTSLACGLQVESFRKIHGNGIATTMCIGNLRSATQNLCEFLRTKNTEFARKSGLYFFTILCFTVGAIFRQSGRGPLGGKGHPLRLPPAGRRLLHDVCGL